MTCLKYCFRVCDVSQDNLSSSSPYVGNGLGNQATFIYLIVFSVCANMDWRANWWSSNYTFVRDLNQTMHSNMKIEYKLDFLDDKGDEESLTHFIV